MKTKLRALLGHPRYRYLLIGVGVYIFELLVIVAATRTGAKPVLAVAISFWFGLLLSFGLQKFVTFRDKRVHHKVLLPQIIAISLLVAFNFFFTLTLTSLLASSFPPTLTRTIALGITTLWNYYLYKTHIFKQPNEVEHAQKTSE